MSLRSIPLLLLVFPLALTAQGRQGVIYKCRDASGHVSYQSQICPPGTEVRDLKVFTDPGIDPDIIRSRKRFGAAGRPRKSANVSSIRWACVRPTTFAADSTTRCRTPANTHPGLSAAANDVNRNPLKSLALPST